VTFGRIVTNAGDIVGTAWLVAESYVVTAAHCVGAEGETVQIEFKDSLASFHASAEAKVVVRDELKDAALLKLETPFPGQPFEICARGSTRGLPWNGTGFPEHAVAVQFLAIDGTVAHFSNGITTSDGSTTAIQLTCVQADSGGWAFSPANHGSDNYSVLRGISGAAVCLPSQGNRVVGFIRCSPGILANTTIYATPIEEVWDLFKVHIPDLRLHAWRGEMAFVRKLPDRPVVETNIDDDLISSIWSEQFQRGFDLDLMPRDHPQLAGAIARLLLHSPALGRIQTQERENWRRYLKRTLEKWFPCSAPNGNQLVTNLSERPPDGQLRGAQCSFQELSNTIHRKCDRLTLDKIDRRLSDIFNDPGNARFTLRYHISDDLAASMSTNWNDWRQRLLGDTLLLHHFLALSLTPDAEFDYTTDNSPGVGLSTINDCLLPSIAFGLALGPLLPRSIIPKALPGNIGNPSLNGHSCGIVIHDGQHLDVGLQNHIWKTRLVFLCSLTQSPSDWHAAHTRMNSPIQDARPSLDRLPPSTNLILCDTDLRTAMRSGVSDVRRFLQQSFDDFDAMRSRYESAAANTAL
jgi:hypothetical protein